jgi:hypothetical protein
VVQSTAGGSNFTQAAQGKTQPPPSSTSLQPAFPDLLIRMHPPISRRGLVEISANMPHQVQPSPRRCRCLDDSVLRHYAPRAAIVRKRSGCGQQIQGRTSEPRCGARRCPPPGKLPPSSAAKVADNPVVGNKLRWHCDEFRGCVALKGKEFTIRLHVPSERSYVPGDSSQCTFSRVLAFHMWSLVAI